MGGHRSSEKIMLNQKPRAIQPQPIALWQMPTLVACGLFFDGAAGGFFV
jgi:hypothetical protein